ncbi:MAG: ATP-binding protein, partial [Myxococcales bacterium]|nr:ATP-binding protein [Myxococcales bacterium]
VTYPSSVMLIAAMNPCPCGFDGSSIHQCRCSFAQVQSYQSRVSGPLLDRIDLHTTVDSVSYAELTQERKEEPSVLIRERVVAARQRQDRRFRSESIHCNAEMSSRLIERHCEIDRQADKMLEHCVDVLGLSARSYSRILKVSRTIADLAGSEVIAEPHVAEAIGYRQLTVE